MAIEVGDTVRIIDGPLKGKIGKVNLKAFVIDTELYQVEIENWIVLTFEHDEIEKIEDENGK